MDIGRKDSSQARIRIETEFYGYKKEYQDCGITVTTHATIKHVDWSWLAPLREWGIFG
jgi:hypothetical protein